MAYQKKEKVQETRRNIDIVQSKFHKYFKTRCLFFTEKKEELNDQFCVFCENSIPSEDNRLIKTQTLKFGFEHAFCGHICLISYFFDRAIEDYEKVLDDIEENERIPRKCSLCGEEYKCVSPELTKEHECTKSETPKKRHAESEDKRARKIQANVSTLG